MSAPPAFVSALLQAEGVRHGFFGRSGGVSRGIYAGLNAGSGSRDDPAAIAENRRRIAAAFGKTPDQLASVRQVHSPTAYSIQAPFAEPRPEGDGLVTTTPGLLLTVLTADCAPILLADPEAGVIGAAHAGWRGALGGVIERTLDLMIAAGARPERIRAAIGPCIRQPSYEVGPEFETTFLRESPADATFFKRGAGDRRLFDLPGFCTARLRRAGVIATDSQFPDTFASADALFSHRRAVKAGEDDYGRNCAAIMLNE